MVDRAVSGPRVIVALDYADGEQALGLSRRLDPSLCRLKVGKELFTREGPALVKALTNLGYDVFLDLKFHDIPNTVAQACAAAADLGVWMINLHALGGRGMMTAAREALERAARRPLLIAVTVLTSLDDDDMRDVGLSGGVEENVLRLATLARDAGLDGVVCSAREAPQLRLALGDDFHLVTPGIRPASSAIQDQKRTVTPYQAAKNGSDYLVIGRPITQARDPLSTLRAIQEEIARR